jgi:MFS family permease
MFGKDTALDAPAGASAPSVGLLRGFLRNRSAVLISVGYTFHAWELLAMWSWTPAFLTAVLASAGDNTTTTGWGIALAATFHLMGLGASGAAGWMSDRLGRTAVILGMATISALCSFIFGWMIAAPLALVVAVGIVYSFTAIGDSAVFSTAFTELVDPEILGASLAVRSLAGFGAGAVASWVFGIVLDLTNRAGAPGQLMTWGWSFSALGLGGLVSIAATARLRALPESERMAEGSR